MTMRACGGLLLACLAHAALPAAAGDTDLPNPADAIREGVSQNNYLRPLVDLQAREAEYLASPLHSFYLDYMAYLTSWVGDREAAYAYEERFLAAIDARNKSREKNARDLTESSIDGYVPQDALEVIPAVAGGRQVVMINEEHRTPVHRALTLRLLPLLWEKGFRYFAVETLYEGDTDLNARGYPTQSSGYYSADPVFGDMLRTALAIGYTLVPYEFKPPERCMPSPENPMSCHEQRERGQAQNLVARILEADPEAKILVHAGRDHNAKIHTDYLSMMAWHFKQISAIDPFTVDQMHMSERRNRADEKPLYRHITSKKRLTEPVAFRSEDGDWWGGANHDLTIVHPRARFTHGRPTWLLLGGLRQPWEIDRAALNISSREGRTARAEPVLVQAFVAAESADAVPVDQIVLYPGQDSPALMLPSGTIRIRAINAAGVVLGRRTVSLP